MIGYNPFTLKTPAGGSVQLATNYAMTFDPAASNEAGAADEMWPVVGNIAAVFGDENSTYTKFLST